MGEDNPWVMMALSGLAIICVVFLFPNMNSNHVESTIKFYDCYYAEAPFGKIWVDTEGHFVFGSGNIDSQLRESYIVKYWVNQTLLSKTLDAVSTPIIVDGTFRLEESKTRTILGFGYNSAFILHLPSLPNQTKGAYP